MKFEFFMYLYIKPYFHQFACFDVSNNPQSTTMDPTYQVLKLKPQENGTNFGLLLDAATFVHRLVPGLSTRQGMKPTKKMKPRNGKLVGCLVQRNFIVNGLLTTFIGVVCTQTGDNCRVYWPRDHSNTCDDMANLTKVITRRY